MSRSATRSLARPLAALAALALGACALSPPPHALGTEIGVVRAATPTRAAAGAHELEVAHAGVVEQVPGLRQIELEVWLLADSTVRREASRVAPRATGATLELRGNGRRILVSDEKPPLQLRNDLAHELVHALLDDDWDPLPQCLEEGLADVVALRVARSEADRIGRLIGAWPERLVSPRVVGRLERDGAQLWTVEWSSPPEQLVPKDLPTVAELLSDRWDDGRYPDDYVSTLHLYGVGFVLVEEIVRRGGVKALRSLCEEARAAGRRLTDPDRVLAAAGVTNAVELRALLRRPLDPSVALWLVFVEFGEFEPVLAAWRRVGDRFESPEAFVDAWTFEAGIGTGRPVEWRSASNYREVREALLRAVRSADR